MTNPLDSAFPLGYLTKREYFAALAMQGIINGCYSQPDFEMKWVGDRAVEFADALIASLNKEEED